MWPIIETFTISFWALVAVWILFELAFSVEHDKGWRFTALFVFLGVLWAFSDFNPFAWAWAHPLDLAIYAVGYITVGIVWSLVKWMLFIGDKARQYEQSRDRLRADWDKDNEGRKARGSAALTYGYWLQTCRPADAPPKAAAHADRLQFWMAWWPFSMVTTLIGDLIFRAFERLYRFFSGAYDRISRFGFRRFDADFESTESQ